MAMFNSFLLVITRGYDGWVWENGAGIILQVRCFQDMNSTKNHAKKANPAKKYYKILYNI